MSYLNTPRLVFAGNFIADPSTVNNDPEHFDDSTFLPNYQQPSSATDLNGWWNPDGTGNWTFTGCTVQQVFYNDGTSTTDPNVDPIIGATLASNTSGAPAKLVDLDPEQQMVSQIWGLQITLGQPQNGLGFAGDFEVAPFRDIWLRFPAGSGDTPYSAFYQSVLTNTGQFGAGNSRFLQELSAAFSATSQLSIKFNVDGYNNDPNPDDPHSSAFTQGRVVGSIGAYIQGEPQTFVAKRALQGVPPPPPQPPPPLYTTVYAQIDGNVLTLDLGNALTTQSSGGAFVNVGVLYAVVMNNGIAVPIVNNTWQESAINYQDANWYEQTAGIVSFTLDTNTLNLIAQNPLAIVSTTPHGMTTLFAEAPNGMWLCADTFVFRLNPGDKASTTFYATQFGQPAEDQPISLGYDPSAMRGQTTQGLIPGPQVVGQPQSALTFYKSLTTGADGTAVLTMQAADPGKPRTYIDGQLYGVSYALGSTPPPLGSVGNASMTLNVLVWSGYDAPPKPTWVDDVQPILQQYANLYPYMMKFVHLGDYNSVFANREHIKKVMSLPVTDPAYMPVVRDLSQAKVNMIVKWLDNPIESANAAAPKY